MESVTFKVGDKVKVCKWTGAQTGTIVRGPEGTDIAYVVALDESKKTWFPKCGYTNCVYHNASDMTLITPPVKVGDTVRIVKSPCTWLASFSKNQLVTVTAIRNNGEIEASGVDCISGKTIFQYLHRDDYEAYSRPITPLTPKWLADTLKESYPHGHPDFIPDMLKIMELHSVKNHDYASGGDALGNFDRVADLKRLYPGFPWDSPFGVAWGNMLKQFDAVMWGMAKNIEHKVEGLDARLQDIIVYSAIGRLILRRGTK